MIKVLAFDFDGTIVDSVYESFIVALEAYRKMGFKIKQTKVLENKFRKLRSLVKNAEDYYAVFEIIKKGLSIDINQKEFNTMNEKVFDNKGKKFAKLFYATRDEIKKGKEKEWLKLFTPYPKLPEHVIKLSKKYKVVISTAKDKNSVTRILKDCGIVIGENILDREDSTDKRDHMEAICKNFNVKPSEVLFVDDILDQAEKVKTVGVNVAMVSWGYSNEEQRKEAKEKGIRVIDKIDELGLY